MHVIFPQPLLTYIKRPNSTHSTVEANIPKYDIECANAARLLCLNSSTKDSKLGTFISSTETVGIDENLTCADPARQAISYSILLRLRNVPNIYQSAHITKCHLPKKMTWLRMDRSHAGALTLQVAKIINFRLGIQNAVSSVQRWKNEIANCEAIKDLGIYPQ